MIERLQGSERRHAFSFVWCEWKRDNCTAVSAQNCLSCLVNSKCEQLLLTNQSNPGSCCSSRAWRHGLTSVKGRVFCYFFKAKEQQERSSIDQLCSQPPVVVPCLRSLSLMCFAFLYFSLVPLFTISLRVWVPGPRKQQVCLGYQWARLL